MDSSVVIVVVMFLAFGLSLYSRYKKKQGNQSYGANKPQSDSSLRTGGKDDDYEPYSGKKYN